MIHDFCNKCHESRWPYTVASVHECYHCGSAVQKKSCRGKRSKTYLSDSTRIYSISVNQRG